MRLKLLYRFRNCVMSTWTPFVVVISILLQANFQNVRSETIDATTESSNYGKITNSLKNRENSRDTSGRIVFTSPRNFPSTEMPKIIQKRNHDLIDNEQQIQKTLKVVDNRNNSREGITHEGSEREPVVYLSESSGYIPLTALRRPSPPPYHQTSGETWQLYNRKFHFNNTRVQHIEAECQDDYMKIRIGFNGTFAGLLYSSGYAYDPDCMYINGSGRDYYEFYIQLNRCGTLGKNAIHDNSRKNPTKNFMWNTITVQYNPLIEEEFDEHFKVTCEYGYDFWKTVTFPFLDVEVATGNPVVFTLSPPECYMEVRNGYGVGGNRVSGPVRVGDPLTLIIYMRSKYDGFDIVVNDCYAHNGANKKIQLIDEFGCPVDDKLISKFRGSWSETGVFETQVYAFLKTFRFTGSPALYIECDVRMCHGRCPTQSCNWRNVKGVTKRDLSNKTETNHLNDGSDLQKLESTLSDNISLFQSLRVLQEGESDSDENEESEKRINDLHETCLKTSLLSALTAGCCIVFCILTGSLLAACAKLRYRKKESQVYNAYINHKGQID